MNDLYLIGNGFDLAHGLKTSYNDFLLWYLNDFFKNAFRKDHYEDDLLKIDRQGLPYNLPSDFSSIKDISQKLKDLDYRLKAKHDFFEGIIENYRDYKWVDIEYEYYMALVDIYKRFEKTGLLRDKNTDNELESLNKCFDLIKGKLEKYLSIIKNELIGQIPDFREILLDSHQREVGQEKLFVCFNYTPTVEHYLRDSLFEDSLIYIHGELNDSLNPVIFGYGDEMDPFYEKIENLNNNEFLRNIKSFNYFKTDNYQKVIRFIEGKDSDFTVKILGHSCGLSDRILLNTIFEHSNCKHIKIFHYEKSPTESDYFEKTQEISRHFKASNKGEMRLKIVPFDKYSSIPQNSKEN